MLKNYGKIIYVFFNAKQLSFILMFKLIIHDFNSSIHTVKKENL